MRRKRIEKASRDAFRTAKHASVGLELGVSVVIGCLLGFWLDQKLNSQPWGLLGGVVLGLAAAVRSITRTLKEMNAEDALETHAPPHPETAPEDGEPTDG